MITAYIYNCNDCNVPQIEIELSISFIFHPEHAFSHRIVGTENDHTQKIGIDETTPAIVGRT